MADWKGWSDFKPGEVLQCVGIPVIPPYNKGHFTIGKTYTVYIYQNDKVNDHRGMYSLRTDSGGEVVVNHPSFAHYLCLVSTTKVMHYKPGSRAMALSHRGMPCTEVVYEFIDGKCWGWANNDRSTLGPMPAFQTSEYVNAYMTRMGWVEVGSIVVEHGEKPKTKTECECGSGTEMRSQGHSTWCKLYMREF